LNLYTYCENDPIIYSDPTGNYAAYVVQALESPYGQEIIAAAKALGMKVGQYVSLYGPLIENKAIAAVDKGKKVVSKGSKWLKGKLSSSGGQDPNKFKGTSKLKNVYRSRKEAPNFPKGFKTVKNGLKKVNIKNRDVLNQLRKVESGTWKKVFKDGYDASGRKISIHYFESASGKVFDVKVKSGWSN
jgi:hypothetical protein